MHGNKISHDLTEWMRQNAREIKIISNESIIDNRITNVQTMDLEVN